MKEPVSIANRITIVETEGLVRPTHLAHGAKTQGARIV